jgi:hypothetical protein
MFGRVLTVVTLGAMIALLLVLQSTSPSTVGPVGILAVFFLFYVISVGVCTWAIHGVSLLLHLVTIPILFRTPSNILTMTQSYYFGSVVALGPIMLLAMGSVAKIGVYEVGLVLVFVSISLFYVKKRLG